MMEEIGWLSVDDQYDGRDDYVGTNVELYEDGPDLGKWLNVIEALREFHGLRVRIHVEVSPP